MIYSACPKRRIGTPHHADTSDRNAASRRYAAQRNAAHRSAGRNIHVVVRKIRCGLIPRSFSLNSGAMPKAFAALMGQALRLKRPKNLTQIGFPSLRSVKSDRLLEQSLRYLLSFFTTSPTFGEAKYPGEFVVSADTLNVRLAADTTGKVADRLHWSQKIEVLEVKDD